MAKFRIIFIVLALIIGPVFSVSVLSANEIRGEIIDIFGDNITTIQIDGSHNISVGDQIDLTYMAGVLPMAIGVYEVTTVQDNVVLSKPVSMTIPANKGMNVQIDILESQTAKKPQVKDVNFLREETSFNPPNPAGMDLPSRDPRFMNVPPEQREIKYENNSVSDVKVKGEVVEAMGTDVRIKLEAGGAVQKGFVADISYMTSSGMELPVGKWIVESVRGTDVTAKATDTSVTPRKGMKATVYKTEEKISVVKDLPANASSGKDDFLNQKNIFEDDQSFAGKGYDEFQAFFGTETPPALPMPKGDAYVLGNKNAAVTVTEFADFQCMWSKKTHPKVQNIIRSRLDKVKYVFRPFPQSAYPGSVTLAYAAYAAGEQGKFAEMVEALFEAKGKLDQNKLNDLAFMLGLDVRKFIDDMTQKKAKWDALIKENADLAGQWKVPGTPAYYINGKHVPHNDIKAFANEIDKAANSSENFAQIVSKGVVEVGQPKRHYWLGVEIMNNEDANGKIIAQFLGGAIIKSVMANSPAEKAGLKEGDHLLRVNGTGVNNTKHFVDLINRSGGTIKVELRRNGKNMKKTIKLDEVK